MARDLPKQLTSFLHRLHAAIVPPGPWRLPVLLVAGVGIGLGAVTLHISNATSYLSDRPEACINCHIMEPQYATWERSSHGRVTHCNDCHVPHDTIARKYAFKARDGLRHAFMFTFRMEPQVIKVHAPGKTVIQENCVRCHEDLLTVHSDSIAVTFEEVTHGQGKLCWDCHRETPHGRVHSLSSTQWARVPANDPVLPEWLIEQLGPPPSSPDEQNH